MRKVFVETKNVKRFVAMCWRAVSRCIGIPRFYFTLGVTGTGKSETMIYSINHYFPDAVYVRCIKIMSARWLLEELVGGLGLEPQWRSKDLFDQARDALIGTDRIVIFDEIDHLTYDSRIIETMRDLNDLTNAPFIFVGMHNADRKLKRFPHLWRRFSEVIRFELPDREDATSILTQVCEVKIDDSVIDAVCATQNLTISLIYHWAQKIEGVARSKGLGIVSADDLFNNNQSRKKNDSKTNNGSIRLSA